MKKLLNLLLCVLVGVTASAQSVTSFNPISNKSFYDAEIPNYGRGAQFWNGTPWNNVDAPQVPPGVSNGKTLYTRFEWTSMETTQGVYTFTGNWPSLEYYLKSAANKGQTFGFGGVMTAYDGQHGLYYDGAWSVYPQYLHNLMQAEPATPDWKYNGTNNWIPNWNSPSYLARWEALNDTIYKFIQNWSYTPTTGPWAGKLVTGKKILDWADIRGYGNFGEWHTYPWTNSQPANAIMTDSSFKKIVDVTKNIFKDIPIHILIAVFDDNPWTESNAWRAYYVLTQKNDWGLFGWRRDNIGDKGYDNFLIGNTWTYGPWRADTAILDRWKYAMITGEPLNGSGSGNCCPIYYHIRPEIGTYHYMGFGNGNYGVRTPAAFDTINNDFKLTGYRYTFGTGNITSELVVGKPFVISLNWRNVGASPLYMKRFKVRYKLLTPTDSVAATFNSKLNLLTFLPTSGDSLVVDTFTMGSVPTNYSYKLVLAIEDTTGLCGYIAPAVNGLNSNNSLTLSNVLQVNSVPLPVKWGNIYLQTYSTYNSIVWNAYCSPFTARFAVERSLNGVSYTELASLPQTSNCSFPRYSYNHVIQTTDPSFYRVKAVDLDSTATYSAVLYAKPNVTPSGLGGVINLYPNPTAGTLTVSISGTSTGPSTIRVFNMLGQPVLQQSFFKAPSNQNVTMSIASLAVGNYTIYVGVNGTTVGIKQLVKY